MAENIREIVLDTLLESERGKIFSHRIVADVLEKYDYLEGQEKRFLKRLTEGCIERRIELDYLLDHYASLPARKMKPLIRVLLRMGVYQILYMEQVPDSAACNEAVKLAAKRKFGNLKGFVNGILRKISADKEHLPYPDREKEPQLFLSVRYSMPSWIVEMWIREYGTEKTEEILQYMMEIHPVTIRFAKRIDLKQREAYLRQYEQAGITVCSCDAEEGVYTLSGAEGIANLPGYPEGAFLVQDISSVRCLQKVGFQAQDRVLDVCASPGGKTVYAAERAAQVLSRDVSEEKMVRLRENIERMQLMENVRTEVFDARECDEALLGKMDVVLLDVPCSGLGVLGKKRDVKYRLTPEGLKELEGLQKEIVDHSVLYVKKGGTLMYSTCTIRREENEEMCAYIEKNYPFRLVEMKQILPENGSMDGFFYGKFTRTNEG